jgi:CHAD domain-containing protein
MGSPDDNGGRVMTRSAHQGSDAQETEWQFEAADLDNVDRWLRDQPTSAALTFKHTKDVVQRDTYLDTEAWEFHRANFSLRIRRAGDRIEATLKALNTARGALQTRREISQPLAGDDIDLLKGDGPVCERLHLLAGARAIVPLFDIETHRRTFVAEAGGMTVAELALDDSRIERKGQVLGHLTRVEVECATNQGPSPLLHSFVDALAETLDLQPALLSKFAAGLSFSGLVPEPPVGFDGDAGTPEDDAFVFALKVLRRFFAEMLSHEPGTRIGEDSEELHHMRVAVRRLRAALSMFREALTPEFEEIRSELGWLGRSLGEVRDLDVQAESLQEQRAGASWAESNALGELLQVLTGRRSTARARLIETLESDRYGALLLRLESVLSSDAEALMAGVTVREFVAPILRARHRKFKDKAEALTPESEPAAFHAARIAGKRLRYSTEFSRVVYGKPAERLAAALAEVQDLLGAYQDASVTIDWLRNLAREHGRELMPETLLFMGELSSQQRRHQLDLRDTWPRAFDKVQERWRRLRKQIDRDEPDRHEDEPMEDGAPADLPPEHRRFAGGPLALLRRRRHSPY